MATASSSAPPQKLNKKLYTDITRLKLLDTPDAPVRFRIKKTPFSGDEEDIASKEREEYFIVGIIFPKSKPFNERCYEIELKLTKTFPIDPPEVRFLNEIYHPNVDKEGKFCVKRFDKTFKWTPDTSLVEVIKTVVEHIDNPDIDSAIRSEVGREYQEDRTKFIENATAAVRQHGKPLE